MFHILAKTSAAPQELPCLLGGYRVIIINRINRTIVINNIHVSINMIWVIWYVIFHVPGIQSTQASTTVLSSQKPRMDLTPPSQPLPRSWLLADKTNTSISFLWQLTHQLEILSWSSNFKRRCCRRCGEAATPLTLLESGTSACAGSTTIIKTSSSFFFCQCHLPNTYFGISGPNPLIFLNHYLPQKSK